MADAVEVVFQIDQPGTAAAKLKTLDEMMARLGRTAAKVGIDIDKSVGNINDAPAKRLAGTMGQVEQAAGKGAVKLAGVRSALEGIRGIPNLPAIDGLNQLGAGGGAPLGLLLGGVIMAMTKINEIFVGIKNESIAILKNTEKWANLGKMGRRGGTDESKEDFEKLRATSIEMKKLLALGMTSEAATVSEKMLGTKGLSLAQVESFLAAAKARADTLGIDTRDAGTDLRLKAEAELQKKRTGDFNELNQLRLAQQIQDMDHADKLRRQALDTQAELAKQKRESFQADFGRASKLGGLFDEQEKLRAGLGGADIRNKNADIDNQATALKRAINDAMMSGHEGGPGGRRDLLAQLSGLGMTSAADSVAAGSRERAIKLGQDTLAGAGGDKIAQNFALDQILAATSNIGALTSDQVDVRMKALEQKTGIDSEVKAAEAQKSDAYRAEHLKRLENIEKQLAERNQQGIKITLKDDAGGALKAEMGEAPTPESSGAVTPFNQSAAYRNDPMSGRL